MKKQLPKKAAKKAAKKPDADIASDAELLDWLESLIQQPRHWMTISLSNSKDMGYKKDFLSVGIGGMDVEAWPKGNTLREVLSRARALNHGALKSS